MSEVLPLLVKRAAYAIITLIGLTIITFLLSHAGGSALAISTYLNPQSTVPISVQEKQLEADNIPSLIPTIIITMIATIDSSIVLGRKYTIAPRTGPLKIGVLVYPHCPWSKPLM